MNVCRKILEASRHTNGVQLTGADVELLMSVLGEEIGRVEGDIDRWLGIFQEYERTEAREKAKAEAEASG